jgi:hypothetical protein
MNAQLRHASPSHHGLNSLEKPDPDIASHAIRLENLITDQKCQHMLFLFCDFAPPESKVKQEHCFLNSPESALLNA